MTERIPRVSIGLAVRNGERYLREAVDSLLGQTFADFELIISDNASTDQTAEICQEYAARDLRIRYHRNSNNIGGANNENLTFKMARGEYFRWAAHDDVCAPTLLEKCVAVLDKHPEVVLCYSVITKIDEQGQSIGLIRENNADSPHAHERFSKLARSSGSCGETYGVIRSAVLRRTQLQKNYTNSDRTLLAELGLLGRFYEIPEPLFFKRYHPGNWYVDWRVRMAWFDEGNVGRITFPWWLQLFDLLATIQRTSMPPSTRIRCYLSVLSWSLLKSKHLAKDVLVAVYLALHSHEWRRQRFARLSEWS